MQRLLRITLFISLSLNAMLATAQTQDLSRNAGEARTVKYSAKDIVSITTRPHFTTLILLPAQERILDFVIGDKDAWVLEGTQNFAYLKPTKAGLETSMNLITASGNIYTFYCTSTETAQADLKVFIEPTDEKLLNTAAGAPVCFLHLTLTSSGRLRHLKSRPLRSRATISALIIPFTL